MPVTILLKAIGMTPESILAHFFDFDNFELKSEGGMIEFVPERWKGEMARFDIAGRDGNVIVENDKRINAKHLRDMRSEDHTSELPSLMRISYAAFCLNKKNKTSSRFKHSQHNTPYITH